MGLLGAGNLWEAMLPMGLGILAANQEGVGGGAAIGRGMLSGLGMMQDWERQRMLAEMQEEKLRAWREDRAKAEEDERKKAEQLQMMLHGVPTPAAGPVQPGAPAPVMNRGGLLAQFPEAQRGMVQGMAELNPAPVMSAMMGQMFPEPTELPANLQTFKAYQNMPPEARALFREFKQAGTSPGASVNVALTNYPKGYQEPTSAVKTQLQKELTENAQELADLNQIGKAYRDEYLTYGGKLKRWQLEKQDKAGLISDEDKKWLSGASRFETPLEQWFQAARSRITGASAAIGELERLRAVLLSGDLSPTVFEERLGQYQDRARRIVETKQRLLADGIPLTADNLDAYLGTGPQASEPQQQQSPEAIQQRGAELGGLAERMKRYGLQP